MGDLSFNKLNFPKKDQLKSAARDGGLKLAITINPFVSVESKEFKYGVKEKLFVMERNSTKDKFIPALTWFKVHQMVSRLTRQRPSNIETEDKSTVLKFEY